MDDENAASPLADPASQQKDTVIVLVHGTWAKDAPWSNEDKSKLRATISKALTAHSLPYQFKIFEWTGFNSHGARLKAGRDLTSRLSKLQDTHKKARFFLVSHSHGGNVVLYGLRDLPGHKKNSIAGLVSMAVPFYVCEQRDLSSRTEQIKKILYSKVLYLGALILLGPPVFESFIRADSWWLKIFGYTTIIALMAAWLTDGWRNSLLKWIERFAHDKRDRTIKDMRPPAPPNPPMLCLNPKKDEALGHLTKVMEISDWPFRFHRIYRSIWIGAGLVVGLWWVQRPLILWKGQLAGDLDANLDDAYVALLAATVGAAIFSAIGFALAELARWLTPVLLKGRFYGFGKGPSFYNWFTKITVHGEPPKEIQSPTIVPITVTKEGLLDLRHSGIYKNEVALTKLVNWIIKKSGKEPQEIPDLFEGKTE